MNLRQEADHIVLRGRAFGLHLIPHIVRKPRQQAKLLGRLLRRQHIVVPAAMNVRHHLRIAPHRQLADILQRKAQHAGHRQLRQHARKLRHKVYVRIAKPIADQRIDMPGNHRFVPLGPRPHPRIG